MEKLDLVKIVDDVFRPHGFKRKGNYWKLALPEITKIIHLQRSLYGRYYHINWGFNLNGLEDSVLMHVFNRLGFVDEAKRKQLKSLLDLSADVPENVRTDALSSVLGRLILKINSINTTADVINDLKKRSHVNDVPLKVKEFLDLPIS